jgi:prepilin-type N-terminal cleavage/methylation domain-containing protein
MTTTLPSFVRRATRGYNLLEIIVTVTLIGILTAITYSYCPNLISTGQDKNAIASAQAINTAQQAYSMRVSNALTNWTAAANDAARFQLIVGYIPYASGQTLAQFTPSGYTLTFNAASLNSKVSITGPSGAITY